MEQAANQPEKHEEEVVLENGETPADRGEELVVEDPGDPASDVEEDREGKTHIWFLVASLVTALGVVLAIALSGIWDPYRCSTNDQCRGLLRCFQGHCESPEIWLNEIDRACQQALGLDDSCISRAAWEEIE
ncbi:MAG: hypothetical protein JW797_11875 [Bradymonadales bacterium]|nr:hypothetical protein [Bradymonadales bacterium]